ncbi:MAG: deoxyribonuclease IV [Thermoplasmataceae archaeon]|jgi:deoxyribonuclease-4
MGLLEERMIGGHISTSGGIWKAPERASVFKFRTFQIFSKNQMQWKANSISDPDAQAFKTAVQKFGMSGIMIHASYLLNLGTSDPLLESKVRAALQEEIRRSDLLGAEFLVIHPGSSSGSTEKIAIRNVYENINSASYENMKTTILLETAAGQGNNIGYNFQQISEMIDGIENRTRIGVCFDTCHVFASGYDIKSEAGYLETMDMFDSSIGMEKLKGFHLNDSKKGIGSRLDRHEQIGLGMLGTEGIKNFINDPRFREIPMVLETPKGENGYMVDISTMESIYSRVSR